MPCFYNGQFITAVSFLLYIVVHREINEKNRKRRRNNIKKTKERRKTNDKVLGIWSVNGPARDSEIEI